MRKLLALALSLVLSSAVFAQTPSVTTTIDNLTPTTITASFELGDNCTKYHILASAVGEMDQWVQMFGMPLRDLVISWSLGFESDTTYTWTDMAPNTDYIVYVVAVNATDTSDVLTTTCTTPQAGGEGTSVVTVEVSNENVVTVNEYGEVYAANLGTATVTAKTADGTVTATCEITVTYSILQWIIIYILFGWIWYV